MSKSHVASAESDKTIVSTAAAAAAAAAAVAYRDYLLSGHTSAA
jgi:hypothetical protein